VWTGRRCASSPTPRAWTIRSSTSSSSRARWCCRPASSRCGCWRAWCRRPGRRWKRPCPGPKWPGCRRRNERCVPQQSLKSRRARPILPVMSTPAPDYLTLQRPLEFTPAAAGKVRELIAEEGNPSLKLRVYIQGGGGSGGASRSEPDEQPAEGDLARAADGATPVVDPLGLQYLMGAPVDYAESLHGAQFPIRNPNAKSPCGCGSSFVV